MVGRYAFDRFSGTEEGSGEIKRKDSLNPFCTHAIDTGLNIQNARVIDQSIRGAELFFNFLKESFCLLLF